MGRIIGQELQNRIIGKINSIFGSGGQMQLYVANISAELNNSEVQCVANFQQYDFHEKSSPALLLVQGLFNASLVPRLSESLGTRLV